MVEDDDILHIKGCSSPVQRDFGILLWSHCFLVFTFFARGHDLITNNLTDFSQKEYRSREREIKSAVPFDVLLMTLE